MADARSLQACARTDAVEAAKLDVVSGNLRSSALHIALGSLLLIVAIDSRVSGLGAPFTIWHGVWLAAQLLVAGAFVALGRIFPPATPDGVPQRHRLAAFSALYLVSGALWGAYTWVTIVPGDMFNQVFVMLVIISLSLFYVIRLAAEPRILFAGCAGLFVVSMPNIWVKDNALATMLTYCVPLWLGFLAMAAVRLGHQIEEMIVVRLREHDLAARLSEAHARVEAESASKSAFLANMSHELRTPLNAIIGFSDVMRSGLFGALNERYRDYAGDIHASGEHLLSLINDLLDIAKIEAGRMQLAIEPIDPATIGPQVLRLLKPRADEKGQTLTLTLADAPAVMMADPRAVTQILLNMAGNAVKYTQGGGAIDIAICAEGRDVVLKVGDNGPGIPAEKQLRLFRPFERIDNSYLAGEAGTGLGLALVRELAALHGGEAAIDSVPGYGTVITVRLPDAVLTSAGARAA